MSGDMDHEIKYGKYLDHTYPQAENPSKIKLMLKPHQLTAIHKAVSMEQRGFLKYKIDGKEFQACLNVGILSDIVGYGKTLTALGLIASANVKDICINKENVECFNHGHLNMVTIKSDIDDHLENDIDNYLNTTLVMVPRGPVFLQWIKMIKENTSLKALILMDMKSLKDVVAVCPTYEKFKEYVEGFDLVILKATSLKDMHAMLHFDGKIKYWARIMLDEAHELFSKLLYSMFRGLFYWFITGTPHLFKLNSTGLSMCVKTLLNSEMFVQNTDEFVKSSFDIPPYVEKRYICKMPAMLRAIRGFLSGSVLERINASDYTGAIREMGGTDASIDTMIEILTRNLKRELHNKQCELDMTHNMDLNDIDKNHRIANLTLAISTTQSKLNDLMNRLKEIDHKSCAICMENIDKPTVLECTHIFCMRCILEWIKRSNFPKCPECRTSIVGEKLINIIGNDEESPAAASRTTPQEVKMNKENTLIQIINDKPEGKFLVFSKIENGFITIADTLKAHGITFTEIKGNTACMRNILEKFKLGIYKVILLTTSYAGSGIDISFATDVVIYHKMDRDKIQAVGRAQRVGRKDTLTVHNLLYEDEN